MSNLAAIVVTYNGKSWIEACLNSLQASHKPVQIIVVDNASTDGTPEILKQYPFVKSIFLTQNLGFGQANNIGIREALKADANFVFLLNQDAQITPNTLEILIAVARQNPTLGIISPMQMNGENTAFDSGFLAYLLKNTQNNFFSDLYLNRLENWYPMSLVSAAAWLIRRDCLEAVGGFDPLFFMYGEDDDLCNRVTFHGFGIAIVPTAKIFHHRNKEEHQRNLYFHYLIGTHSSALKHPQGRFINHLVFYLWNNLYSLINLLLYRKWDEFIALSKANLWVIFHLKKLWSHYHLSRRQGAHWI